MTRKKFTVDIARLGEERVVITPAPIKIWREKVVAPDSALPTAD
jgi:SepF-like predicted cell division protein (DUF552 family)